MEGKIKGCQTNIGQACFMFERNGYRVSISMDDSCQMKCPTEFRRSYLKIFSGKDFDDDVTERFFGVSELCAPTIDDVLKAMKLLEEEEGVFTFYWQSGIREVFPGKSVSDAFARAGYGAGAAAALDFHAEGECERYQWNAEKREWELKPEHAYDFG